ncbi:MAG: polysaccharide deacetylase family protein, partial [Verrucomicrobiales bacterium]|nr:polysaccharide deacetylase family protein [Verrucomicrobiales bacterium]
RVSSLEAILEVAPPCDSEETPVCLRALTWEQAAEMASTGLIELGGHTHEHPILSRCTEEEMRDEIETGRELITQRTGRAPQLFAYPNGGAEDFTTTVQTAVANAGYTAGFSVINGFAQRDQNAFSIPRYGAPESLTLAEATVSGAFETLKEWRTRSARKAATV